MRNNEKNPNGQSGSLSDSGVLQQRQSKHDANGNIPDRANMFQCINSTSCQSERDFSTLALTLTNLRQSLSTEKVQQNMLLRLNPMPLPDVAATNDRLAEMQKIEEAGRAKAKSPQAVLASTPAIEIFS